ncbi:hypothetical protein E4U22_007865 [Claviceps purpurea]|nr:hypothetical protein E4U22_007865 [Claviceps purpurea]
MTGLRQLYGKQDNETGSDNFGIDYVIHYSVPAKERAEAEAGFVQLIEALTNVGLATEVRSGDSDSLLVFVKIASADLLAQQVYRGRLQDWLQGIRTSGPNPDLNKALQDEPVTEAERLRLVYQLIIRPENDSGAGINQASSKWKYVSDIFPLHDQQFNRSWIQKWSKKWFLDEADLEDIRNKFGESIAFYFAFLRSYFVFLAFPSAMGFAAWMLLGQFSSVYALGCGLWSVIFLEYWKKKEVDLAVQWGVRGVSAIQLPRPEFEWDYEAEDAVTGEPVKVYSYKKRFQTQLLQIPFAIACIVVLGGLVVIANSLEIFITQVYDGPGKQYLVFVPTMILVVFTPTFSAVLMKAASVLTHRENYDTVDAHKAALVQKQFVLNFMTSYMALLFTGFVYIPFGDILLPFLDFWRHAAQTLTFSEKTLPTQQFRINPERISSQMFYCTVTAQVVNFATEVIVPYAKQKAFAKAKELQSRQPEIQDEPEEAAFLKRVRDECALETYDVTDDYREMVMQFGYLSLFSVAWPMAACCFLINNWVELRSDGLKIAVSCKRPIPWRSDSIGPWLDALGFLSWLGSITSAAIVFLCSGAKNGNRGTASQITAWGCLLSVLLAEHFYLLMQQVVRMLMNKVESIGVQRERRERYLMKKRLLAENLGQAATSKAAVPGIQTGEKMTREALEDEAREASVRGRGGSGEMFWQRQRGMEETILIGRKLIEVQTQTAAAKGKTTRPAPSRSDAQSPTQSAPAARRVLPGLSYFEPIRTVGHRTSATGDLGILQGPPPHQDNKDRPSVLSPCGMSTPRNRFHDGCWTCKAKRFQCDRTRPHCLTCTQKGFKCEGYEMRLKWGTGIASRGRFAGASQPVEAAIPPRVKGRHRDLLREERRREAAAREASASGFDARDAARAAMSSDSESSPSHLSDLPLLGPELTVQEPKPAQDGLAKQDVARPPVSRLKPKDIPPWILKQGDDEVRLFSEFVNYGINTLFSTSVNDEDNILAEHLPRISQESDALCAICITIQASLCGRPEAQHLIFKYFDMALSSFRAELGNSVKQLKDGTFAAGLMLSTLGLNRGCGWTMHLHGIYNVSLTRGLQEPLNSQPPFRKHLIEVLGYLDLPGFAVGRQNPSIGVWRRHCREPGYLCRPPQVDSVEFVSGLPRSLLDLLSAIDGMEITEEDLWDWPGSPGSLTQCHLWEAYRLSGIISLRNPQLYTPIQISDPLPSSPSEGDGSSQASSGSRRAVPTSTDVIVTRIISHVDAITRAYVASDGHRDSLLFNAIDYPLFVAGIEADVMNARPELKDAIKNCFAVRAEAFKYPSRGTALLDIMGEWWTCSRDGRSINDLATSRGLELGLV